MSPRGQTPTSEHGHPRPPGSAARPSPSSQQSRSWMEWAGGHRTAEHPAGQQGSGRGTSRPLYAHVHRSRSPELREPLGVQGPPQQTRAAALGLHRGLCHVSGEGTQMALRAPGPPGERRPHQHTLGGSRSEKHTL